MPLTRKEKLGLFSAFGAVILSSVVYIAIREWYSHFIKYKE
jgi:hypothetical protein